MKDTAKIVAKKLLEISAIKLNVENPFSWASGWKSPIYCDNRLSLSYPEVRTYIKNQLANTIKENFDEVEAIAGVATAGIPQGALVADALNIPFIYVRSKPKGHGMENLIEGKITAGQKVVVIEDLVSTGGSSLKAIEALKKSEFSVLGMVSIFTYGFPIAEENFTKEKVKLISLSSYTELIDEALNLNFVTQEQISDLKKWRENPATWGV
ncbi:MAG: orotate phosphoribosyltransferase [Cyclobacteriaceae bacterium]|nr:orotate phosphoribosyltransferase [Cyclobacteriaceae bacterium]